MLFLPHQGAARTAVLSAVAALNSSGVRLIPNPALPLPLNASLPSQEQARPRCSHPARRTPHGPWAPRETFHLLRTHLFLRGFSSFQATALHAVQTSRFLFLLSVPESSTTRLPRGGCMSAPSPELLGLWVAGPRPVALAPVPSAALAGAGPAGVCGTEALCVAAPTPHVAVPACLCVSCSLAVRIQCRVFPGFPGKRMLPTCVGPEQQKAHPGAWCPCALAVGS